MKSKIADINGFVSSIKVWNIILVFSIIIVGLGVLEAVQYSRLNAFINCQADYNQQSSEARVPRTKAQDEENDALYAFLITLPPLFDDKNVDQDAKNTFNALQVALKTHQHRQEIVKKHPYPQEPNKSCGVTS